MGQVLQWWKQARVFYTAGRCIVGLDVQFRRRADYSVELKLETVAKRTESRLSGVDLHFRRAGYLGSSRLVWTVQRIQVGYILETVRWAPFPAVLESDRRCRFAAAFSQDAIHPVPAKNRRNPSHRSRHDTRTRV